MTTTGAASAAQSDAEQDKWLSEVIESVGKCAFYMKRALDSSNLREALKMASQMISELRTSKLDPNNYYQLYMAVTDELRELEMYFEEEDAKEQSGEGGRSIVSIYELVQHAGNIIPRLYLLITVGSVYVKSKKAPAKDVLFDLQELCRGVQQPTRGLFLRNYLSQISKDKLPDIGSEYEGAGGTVRDSIEFVLQNFGEMNKLWVRMQHQGAVRDRSRREKERRNLRQLVGTNLVRLSELAGVDLATYKEMVLPRILEQVINCKDTIAQEYLMDCIINVFPDDFHLATLETFLSTCQQLQESVNVKDIIINLMNRLSNFAKQSPENIPKDMDMFPLFHKYSSKIISSNSKMPLNDILALQVALMNFATTVYADRLSYVDSVLGFGVEVLKKAGTPKVDNKCVKQVVELLTLPLKTLSLAILNLENYGNLLAFLDLDHRKQVAITISNAVLKARTLLDTVEKVDTLLKFISPLVKDEGERLTTDDPMQFDEEQHLVARVFHLIYNQDTDQNFLLYSAARKHFGSGGTKRIQYTLPPVVFASLQLCQRVFQREEQKEQVAVRCKKIFGFIHESISVLTPHYPELALRLFLHAASVSNKCKYEAICYEFVAQAFIAYEDEITDNKAQCAAINLVVATLLTLNNLSNENYDTLSSKATQHCAKLLKKTDQCRAVATCAHLFWPPMDENKLAHRDEKHLIQCLSKSLKTANACMGQQVELFVEIFNHYLYFYDKRVPSLNVKYLKGMLTLLEDPMSKLDNSENSRIARAYYNNTLEHINYKKSLGDENSERYNAIFEAGDDLTDTQQTQHQQQQPPSDVFAQSDNALP